ncbi:MAG: tetratricopeptide repeat protein [Zoogloeaceae bacterium]|jgi:tetratricopeptide (TPR) repeat protein|nr:tetratricopeptide repeat protein [Zoogloeaceae bacterium]
MVYALRPTLFALCATVCLGITPAFAADNSLTEIQLLVRQGQYPQALNKVDSYLASRPKDAQGRFIKGLIFTEMKRGDDAIAIFTKLTEDYPELPEPYNNLAVLYAQQKQYDRARGALEMAIRTHPSYAIAYENLGDVYAKLASQAYDKALQLDTSNAAAQSKLAMIRDLVSAPDHSRATNVAKASTTPVVSAPARTQPAVEPKPEPKPAAQPMATVIATTPTPATPAITAPAAAPTTPTLAPKKTETAAADTPQEIAKTLAAWADAWSRQDVKAYLGFYAPAFKPGKGNRKDWEAERAARIRRPAWIKVSYTEPKISIEGKQATARFRQTYQASGLKTATDKTLIFTRAGNVWLILSEESN